MTCNESKEEKKKTARLQGRLAQMSEFAREKMSARIPEFVRENLFEQCACDTTFGVQSEQVGSVVESGPWGFRSRRPLPLGLNPS